jgi:hypothetical protein
MQFIKELYRKLFNDLLLPDAPRPATIAADCHPLGAQASKQVCPRARG